MIFMVGRPATGKSYLSKKLARYLTWLGFRTRIFNVGDRRRKEASITPVPCESPAGAGATSAFFDPTNSSAAAIRDRLALETLDEALYWLAHEGGKVAIHDATNSTVARRQLLGDRVLKASPKCKLLFLESVCTDSSVIERNVRMKLFSPDYVGMDPNDAISDFQQRMKNYDKAYVPLGESEEEKSWAYIKVINVGEKIITAHLRGYLCSQLVFYLMNINIAERTIWLSRHGESEFNVEGRLGGDPSLTPRGRKYAAALGRFLEAQYANEPTPPSPKSPAEDEDDACDFEDCSDEEGTNGARRIPVWTSTLRRARETASLFPGTRFASRSSKLLNEIHSGVFEGMTPKEIDGLAPGEVSRRAANKLSYRYPGLGGESYLDVVARLKPVIIESERIRHDVAIVTHNVVARVMLSYYLGTPLEEMPQLVVPLHHLYALRPRPYGAALERFTYDEEKDMILPYSTEELKSPKLGNNK
jgi:6-phosphofructo-2-kinase